VLRRESCVVADAAESKAIAREYEDNAHGADQDVRKTTDASKKKSSVDVFQCKHKHRREVRASPYKVAPSVSLVPSAMHCACRGRTGTAGAKRQNPTAQNNRSSGTASREGFRNNSDVISIVLPSIFHHFKHSVYSTSIYVKRWQSAHLSLSHTPFFFVFDQVRVVETRKQTRESWWIPRSCASALTFSPLKLKRALPHLAHLAYRLGTTPSSFHARDTAQSTDRDVSSTEEAIQTILDAAGHGTSGTSLNLRPVYASRSRWSSCRAAWATSHCRHSTHESGGVSGGVP